MALNDYAVYIDVDASGNYSPQTFRNPTTRPSGGVRLPINYVTNDNTSSLQTVITNATNATPIVITSTAHGLAVDDTVFITGVLGNTAANGTFIVSVVADANTFTLRDSAGSGAYTSNTGYAKKILRDPNIITSLQMGIEAVIQDKSNGA
jgi:hypothetical protein